MYEGRRTIFDGRCLEDLPAIVTSEDDCTKYHICSSRILSPQMRQFVRFFIAEALKCSLTINIPILSLCYLAYLVSIANSAMLRSSARSS